MSLLIECADASEVDALCAIEREAVQLFRGHAAWPAYADMPIPSELLAQAIGRGMVWVACGRGGEPMGFIWLDADAGGDVIGIADFNVRPDCARRGVGAALLEHACRWAAEAGYRQMHLGTLADVPWNAPFYRKHGFVAVEKDDPSFAYALQRDEENGFPDSLRVFMRRSLEAAAWSRWPAPAKLNLFLRILGRREDGYHELQTVFRLLDWGDEVRLRPRSDGQICRLQEIEGVPAEQDLVVRAAKLLQRHADITAGVDIELSKRIPMGGGLGGGSSDAATILVALNHLWKLDLTEDQLAEIGLQLGADVPVFVRGRSAWAEGVGDQLSPIELPMRHYVVVDPGETVPTAALFQAAELTRHAPRATISSFASGETAENAFESVVRSRHPRVAAALDWLGGFGQARLSGSGGCVFLEARSLARVASIAEKCPSTFRAHVATGVQVSPLQDALARHRRVL